MVIVYYSIVLAIKKWMLPCKGQRQIFQKGVKVIMMADFYYPSICRETNSALYDCFRKFLTCFADSFLLQRVVDGIKDSAVIDWIQISWEYLIDEAAGTGGGEDNSGLLMIRKTISKQSVMHHPEC